MLLKNASWLDGRKEPKRVETVSGTNERHDLDNGFGASAGRLHCVCMRQVRKCEGPLCLKLPFDIPPPHSAPSLFLRVGEKRTNLVIIH